MESERFHFNSPVSKNYCKLHLVLQVPKGTMNIIASEQHEPVSQLTVYFVRLFELAG